MKEIYDRKKCKNFLVDFFINGIFDLLCQQMARIYPLTQINKCCPGVGIYHATFRTSDIYQVLGPAVLIKD